MLIGKCWSVCFSCWRVFHAYLFYVFKWWYFFERSFERRKIFGHSSMIHMIYTPWFSSSILCFLILGFQVLLSIMSIVIFSYGNVLWFRFLTIVNFFLLSGILLAFLITPFMLMFRFTSTVTSSNFRLCLVLWEYIFGETKSK